MPRGRPDPFSQVPDGGRVHLVPALEILEQDRAQLDESQRCLASGDDGVHAGTIGVVGADAAVAVTVERRRIAAGPAVSLTGDEIDERCFLGLLHVLPLIAAGVSTGDISGLGSALWGFWGPRGRRVLAQYTCPNCRRQEGNRLFPGLFSVAEPRRGPGEPASTISRQRAAVTGRGTSCTWRPSRTSTDRCARSGRRSACSPGVRRRSPRRRHPRSRRQRPADRPAIRA